MSVGLLGQIVVRVARLDFHAESAVNFLRMEIFYEVFAFVAAICIGIMVLTAFFSALNYFNRRTASFEIVRLKRFIEDGKVVKVHLSSGEVFTGVRFVGFTDQNSTKEGIPYSLSQLLVCETQKGARVFFRAEAVRIIEELDDIVSAKSPSSGG